MVREPSIKSTQKQRSMRVLWCQHRVAFLWNHKCRRFCQNRAAFLWRRKCRTHVLRCQNRAAFMWRRKCRTHVPPNPIPFSAELQKQQSCSVSHLQPSPVTFVLYDHLILLRPFLAIRSVSPNLSDNSILSWSSAQVSLHPEFTTHENSLCKPSIVNCTVDRTTIMFAYVNLTQRVKQMWVSLRDGLVGEK